MATVTFGKEGPLSAVIQRMNERVLADFREMLKPRQERDRMELVAALAGIAIGYGIARAIDHFRKP